MYVHLAGCGELVSRGLVSLLEKEDFRVKTFLDDQELLGSLSADEFGCVVMRIEPGCPRVQPTIESISVRYPGLAVLISAKHADIALAVQCMKRGAIDFVVDTGDLSVLVAQIKKAMTAVAERQKNAIEQSHVRERLSRLTHRERELVGLICNGMSNKQIAAQLSISTKTVENHRARLMHKTQAVNTADMVRLAITLQLMDRQKPNASIVESKAAEVP